MKRFFRQDRKARYTRGQCHFTLLRTIEMGSGGHDIEVQSSVLAVTRGSAFFYIDLHLMWVHADRAEHRSGRNIDLLGSLETALEESYDLAIQPTTRITITLQRSTPGRNFGRAMARPTRPVPAAMYARVTEEEAVSLHVTTRDALLTSWRHGFRAREGVATATELVQE